MFLLFICACLFERKHNSVWIPAGAGRGCQILRSSSYHELAAQCGFWEPNSGPWQEQEQALLTAEPSLSALINTVSEESHLPEAFGYAVRPQCSAMLFVSGGTRNTSFLREGFGVCL